MVTKRNHMHVPKDFFTQTQAGIKMKNMTYAVTTINKKVGNSNSLAKHS